MLARLFRSNQPGVLVVLLLLVPALFLPHLGARAPAMDHGMPIARALGSAFTQAPWVYGILLMLTVMLLAVQVTELMNEAEVLDRRNHLPALLLPLFLALCCGPGAPGPGLFALPFVVWAMRRCWTITNRGAVLSPLFDAGLLLGVASQFYMPYAFLVVVLWASVAVIRPFQWREYVVPLLGTALVFYLAWGLVALLHGDTDSPLRTLVPAMPRSPGWPANYNWTLALVLAPLVLVSLLRFAGHYGRGVVREQNVRSAFIALLMASTIILLLVRLITRTWVFEITVVPLSMLCSFAFIGTNRAWIGETAILCMALLALWLQYGT